MSEIVHLLLADPGGKGIIVSVPNEHAAALLAQGYTRITSHDPEWRWFKLEEDEK